MPLPIESLTPAQIVAQLDRHIVGQDAAKRAVAVALRNRFRRQRLSEAERQDVVPKNILLIGPTGVGKTEIARRLAQLARAPFVKVEATKFTEVGYVGRDVDAIIRDLVAQSIRLVEAERTEAAREAIEARTLDRLADLVELERAGPPMFAFGFTEEVGDPEAEVEGAEAVALAREALLAEVRSGALDELEVGLDVEETNNPFVQVFTPGGIEEMGIDSDAMGGMFGSKRASRRFTLAEARAVVFEQEAKRAVDAGAVRREALLRAEQTGIVFLDELDKVAIKSGGGAGPDVSREGVQRDLLPIIEGSTVQTKHGPVRTDYVLFIAAGAFTMSKPSDLIPELQGRLPIRVQLSPLAAADFRRILTEPQAALVKQYQSLLRADGVELVLSDGALDEIARFAAWVNTQREDIGARRLHTVLERLLEPLLFAAPETATGRVELSGAEVETRLRDWAADAERGLDLL